MHIDSEKDDFVQLVRPLLVGGAYKTILNWDVGAYCQMSLKKTNFGNTLWITIVMRH